MAESDLSQNPARFDRLLEMAFSQAIPKIWPENLMSDHDQLAFSCDFCVTRRASDQSRASTAPYPVRIGWEIAMPESWPIFTRLKIRWRRYHPTIAIVQRWWESHALKSSELSLHPVTNWKRISNIYRPSLRHAGSQVKTYDKAQPFNICLTFISQLCLLLKPQFYNLLLFIISHCLYL